MGKRFIELMTGAVGWTIIGRQAGKGGRSQEEPHLSYCSTLLLLVGVCARAGV